MQANMTTGHVFPTKVPGIFGVLSYSPETMVSMVVYKDEPSTSEACERLGKKLAGRFIPADSGTAKWGAIVFEAQGSAVLL